jgi:hypothetical protein
MPKERETMKETTKENATVANEAVTKPAWHAPVIAEVDYVKTQASAVVVYPGADAVFYTN